MEVAAKLRPNFVAAWFMAKHDSRYHKLVLEPAAAMIGKAWIVIANDPNPFEPISETAQKLTCIRRQAVAAETVVEAVAKTVEALRAGAFHLFGQRRQRRVRIIWRQELSEPREPARLFEMQVGNEQRFMGRPIKRTISRCEERFACERKGNHEAGVAPACRSGQSLMLAHPPDELRVRLTRSRRPKGSDAAELRRSGEAPLRHR